MNGQIGSEAARRASVSVARSRQVYIEWVVEALVIILLCLDVTTDVSYIIPV